MNYFTEILSFLKRIERQVLAVCGAKGLRAHQALAGSFDDRHDITGIEWEPSIQ